MRSLHLTVGLILTSGFGLVSGAAIADNSDFCLTGTVGGPVDSISCASKWISADGSRLGPVADPRYTPKTPHIPTTSVWSGGTSGTHYSGSGNAAPVWQAPVRSHSSSVQTYSSGGARHTGSYVRAAPTITQQQPAYIGNGQVLVTRGAGHHTLYNTGSRAHESTSYLRAQPVYTQAPAPVVSTAKHHQPQVQTRHDVHNNSCRPGCFTYDAHGQSRSVSCPVATTVTRQTFSHAPAVSVVQQYATVSNSSFYNGLNGGVGYGSEVYYGGGGGGFFSAGGSSSVFGRSPLLRARTNTGGKGKGGHMGKGKGGGHMGKGGGGHGGGGGH
ncbi:hypothetical protein MNBD_ALPHA06-1175 [hydrothermal vent metagenome]|uniref:Uncharacterized protein n=1 Tax=hydrothermal vent metagenome TaxID=652676 RepID=A0A3B0RJ62_9ZZZZ